VETFFTAGRRHAEVGQALGGVGDGDASGGGGHGREARRVGQDAGQGRGQAIDGQVVFQNDLGRARIGQGLGVQALVVVGGDLQRDQDGRQGRHRQFGAGRGAGAAYHQMRL